MIKDSFSACLKAMGHPDDVLFRLWDEIAQAYTQKKRHYHNLAHLEHLHACLLDVKDQVEDWDVLLMAIVYHDIIYQVSKQDNEERSAALGWERCRELGLSMERSERCRTHILATKGHAIATDSDTALFTDADLAILGADAVTYDQYRKAIREEYHIYPSLLYNPGRRKVLHHFLDMPRIYQTTWFQRYETSARENLRRELELIS